ncbi:MAG: arsenic efflux protein [Clostridiales bacterium]|nr:arsenic efflux protein [Clostridiales bacterium]
MLDVICDSLLDSLKLLPFLFLSYLAVEYIEHRMSNRSRQWIYRAGKAGPVIGALVGMIPQCGFSAAAAGLFAAGIVSPGTLLAIFLSTSDEMLPLMLSEGIYPVAVFRILSVKAVVGAAVGLLVDFAARRHVDSLMQNRFAMSESSARPRIVPRGKRGKTYQERTEDKVKYIDCAQTLRDGRNSGSGHRSRQHICEQDHCHCEEQGILRASLYHTAQTGAFILLISLALGFGMDWFENTAFSRGLFALPGVQAALAALIGMIPNCAASVLITELYLEGVLDIGALFAGLLCGAGTGLLVLYRENDNRKENLILTVTLYVSGLFAGALIGMIVL